MLDLNKSLQLNNCIVLRSIGNHYWALNTQTGNQYRLNETAYSLLNYLREPLSIAQIIKKGLAEYNVTRERFQSDCIVALQSAVNHNIVREVD